MDHLKGSQPFAIKFIRNNIKTFKIQKVYIIMNIIFNRNYYLSIVFDYKIRSSKWKSLIIENII